jgi:hypothetical protein
MMNSASLDCHHEAAKRPRDLLFFRDEKSRARGLKLTHAPVEFRRLHTILALNGQGFSR